MNEPAEPLWHAVQVWAAKNIAVLIAWLGSITLAQVHAWLGVVATAALIVWTVSNTYFLWRDKLKRPQPSKE